MQLQIHGHKLPISTCSDACKPEEMDLICSRIKRTGSWEPALLQLAHEAISRHPSELVVDIGSHVGTYVAVAGNAGTGQILAFEPNSHHALALERTIVLNHLNERVLIIREYVSEHKCRLDTVIPLGTIVSFLKADVEGMEPTVIASGKALFQNGRVRCALLEVTPRFGVDRYLNMLTFLADCGYTLNDVGLGDSSYCAEITDVPSFLLALAKSSVPQTNILATREV